MKIKEFLRSLTKVDWFCLGLFFITFPMMELLNRPIGIVRNFHLPLDDKIPLIEELIFAYHLWSPTVIVCGLVFLYRRRGLGRRYFLSLSVAQIIANLTFIFCQTQVPRAPLEQLSTSLAGRMIIHTYAVDNHYCGFPSIHVSLCTILILFIWQAPVKTVAKWLITLWMLLIAASTVLVKQHVFLDIPGGIFNGLLSYVIISYIGRRWLRDSI